MMVVLKSENDSVIAPRQIETNIYRLQIQKTGSAEYLCEIFKNAAIDADYCRLNGYDYATQQV
jgi:hypothetical protein